MESVLLFAAALAAAAAPAKGEQQASRSTLVTAVEACRSVKEDAARLACYDRAVGALAAARAKGDVRVVDRGEIQQVKRSLFGFSVPKLPFFGGGSKGGEPEQKEVTAKLTEFHSLINNQYRFAIDEPSSTWETTESMTMGSDPRKGDKVVIQSGSIGSYFAKFGGNRWVRVRRVR